MTDVRNLFSLSFAFFFISLEFFQNDFLRIENIPWGVCYMPTALLFILNYTSIKNSVDTGDNNQLLTYVEVDMECY